MIVAQVTFQLVPSEASPLRIILKNFDGEEVKRLFSKHSYSLIRALEVTKSPITFKATPERLTDSAISTVFNAFSKLVQAQHTNNIVQKNEEKDDCPFLQDAKTAVAIKFSEDLQRAKVAFEEAKKSSGIDVEFNVGF
jgi:hypothetical protein